MAPLAGRTHHWVFWVGPMSGALIAALMYELTFRPSHDPVRFAIEPYAKADVKSRGQPLPVLHKGAAAGLLGVQNGC